MLNEGLSSEESTKEILRLKQEVELLQAALQQIEDEEPTDIEDICQGDDEFKINYKYYLDSNILRETTFNEKSGFEKRNDKKDRRVIKSEF